jgi:hypothetical protein
MRSDFGFREGSDGAAKLLLFVRQRKIHSRLSGRMSIIRMHLILYQVAAIWTRQIKTCANGQSGETVCAPTGRPAG